MCLNVEKRESDVTIVTEENIHPIISLAPNVNNKKDMKVIKQLTNSKASLEIETEILKIN